MTPRTLAACCALVALLCGATAALAGGTKSLRYTSYREFDDAETKGVLISSLGELSAGFASRKIDMKVPFVRSSVTATDGTIYLGTGDQGEIWAYAGKAGLRKIAKIDTPVISTLAIGPDGQLYCGTVADGRVLAVDPKSGTWKQVAQLGKKGEGHVWALAWDPGRKVLWAGTGPKGELYAIENGVAKQVWSSTEKHLLSLQVAHDGSGALYVGSGERANLYRVEKDGRSRVLHAFAADEIHAIFEKNGSLFIAVNEFSGGAAPFGGGGTRITFGPSTPSVPAKAPLPRMGTRAGKGAIYRWDPDGRIDQLYAAPDTWLAGVHVEANGEIMAAAGGKGSVYLIKTDRTVFTAYEFPQRQVLAMELRGPVKLFGTGDGGSLHLLEAGPARPSVFTAKVFDATFPTRFGALRWSGAGKITFEIRTGNTAKPDKTWSGWGKLEGVVAMGEIGTGRIRAGDVRYLQWRVSFGSERAVLRHLTLYYLQQNQRPRLTEVTIGDAAPGAAPGGFGGFGGFGGAPAAAAARPPKSTLVKIRWKVENSDGDTLNYKLFVREEKDPVWKPLGGPEPMIGKVEFDWQTEAIPDGHYLAKVIVSDEPSNPKDRAITSELVSAVPYLLDHRKPEVTGLEVRYPFLAGRARDSYSVLTELAYSIDGGDWVPFFPSDGIFDSTAKTFAVRLPDNLAPGQHTVAVRTADEAHNVGVAQITFRVGK
ncbi:MAG: PQQ-like beta-propeller repeat protein [Deltaproteobacteria bacterium]|nr:PQQ-like beta-propeller repeat protein [Deltaproteobacteria bacterium]